MSHAVAPSSTDLALLAQVIRTVARARRLSGADAQDFAQTVQLKLLERNYDVFHQFGGRSSLHTYLVVVVTRLLMDWRNSVYGRWRPSAAASRQGGPAISLERLVLRDGYTIEEAIEIVRATHPAVTTAGLRTIAEGLPWHQRPSVVSDDALQQVGGPEFDDPIEVEARRRTSSRIREALLQALQQLPARERQMVIARYCHKRSVQALARTMNTDAKPLYRRCEYALRSLRTELQKRGVTGAASIEVPRPRRRASATPASATR